MAKILIIDDDAPIRDSLEAVAMAAGHDVRTATNGRKGMAEYAAFHPDLVVTDIMMPEQDGLETITQLRRLTRTLPIIAMSGGDRFGGFSTLAAARKLGADRTLTKPFSGTILMSEIAELLPRAA